MRLTAIGFVESGELYSDNFMLTLSYCDSILKHCYCRCVSVTVTVSVYVAGSSSVHIVRQKSSEERSQQLRGGICADDAVCQHYQLAGFQRVWLCHMQ